LYDRLRRRIVKPAVEQKLTNYLKKRRKSVTLLIQTLLYTSV